VKQLILCHTYDEYLILTQKSSIRKEEAAVVTHTSREKKGEERKKEEREEEGVSRFKLWSVMSTGLARMSRAYYSAATSGHATQSGWTASHVTASGTTQVYMAPHRRLYTRQRYEPSTHDMISS
jgi:hypothetical protein